MANKRTRIEEATGRPSEPAYARLAAAWLIRSTRRQITATFAIRFWQEVWLMDHDNISGCIPIDDGGLQANTPFLNCAGFEGRSWLARAKAADQARVSTQPDSSFQADGENLTLSPEEHQIVALIVAGYTNKDMARHCSLSESTIYRRIIRIFGKLGVSNKLELVLFAITRRIRGGAQPEHRE